MVNATNELYHHGVKGMKWGVRRYEKKQKKMARKDAKEFARAKMFYGEGAGTRRKLIKAKVQQRSKNTTYKNEFEKALDEQNMDKHATKAKRERTRKDINYNTRKTARGVVRASTGNTRNASALAVGIVSGYGVMKATGLDKKAIYSGKKAYAKYGPRKKANFI